MTLVPLTAESVGYPRHPAHPADEGGFFALSSHKRAREALRFALEMPGIGYNAFVVGEDRSGRMKATLALLDGYVQERPPQDDWVYLNNFRHPHRPLPFSLPAGMGVRLRDAMALLGPRLRLATREAVPGLLEPVIAAFSGLGALDGWLDALRQDVLAHHDRFAAAPAESLDGPERRYAVNLLVDHGDETCPAVVIEPNQTYENLFGRIEYVQAAGGLFTDFTMIRAGALHRANGGILVLRAEALAKDALVWEAIKAALRDQKIRIEELHRAGSVPLASAPRPMPIPFSAKLVIVGPGRTYHGWFLNDPEARVYFKVKADICDDLRAVPENVAAYVGMVRRMAADHGCVLDDEAVELLLGVAARWAGHRGKLSSRLELLEDLVGEAALLARSEALCADVVCRASVARAVAERRRRVGQAEDRLHRAIADGAVMISTTGAAVGQINALIVLNRGDHHYGCPCRVTARSWIGPEGVINIERDVNLGGPIQHKGVLGLHGYLAGRFARARPVSFSCSVTFEQNYGGIEGDSASLAELLAILSDLAGVPLRQDLAVTGSVNQRGEVQPVSGLNHKIEGFFRSCLAVGDLTGSQGVVIPATNLINVVLHDEVTDAMRQGRFHLWTVSHVEDAVTLFTGLPAGTPDADGSYPPDTVYGRVAARLAEFDRVLQQSRGGRGTKR